MRGNFSKVLFGSITGAGAILSMQSCNATGEKTNARPNVIFVLTDDQGYGDFSVHGNPVLKTPTLDKLHNQSIRLTDFHSAPMSSPTRGQLMTGRDALDNGATAVCMGRSMVREDLPTMADIFKSSGYMTAQFGKWHLGDSYPYRPQDRGFDETVHHGAWGITSIADYFGNSYWNDTYDHNGKYEKYEGYCTDVWFELAMKYMETRKEEDKPFFIYLATNCPHSPHLCDEKYSDPFLEKGMTPVVARFFGQIANIDENMERLLSFLDRTELANNTILIYMTDNGSVAGYNVYNSGMRGHKTEPYEGGHRVPFFIRWPEGNLGQPRDINELTQCQDILPTLIDLCKLKKPINADFDGVSLEPLLTGKSDKLVDRMLVVEYENPYQPEENKAVLWGKWRLVKDAELYDISIDTGQTNNLAGRYPDIVDKMKNYYDGWKAEVLPNYREKRYIHIGTEKANPMMLFSSDWQGSYADNFTNLIAGNHIGSWDIKIETAGKYEITLYRWHPASGLALDSPVISNNKIVGAVPISKAELKIGQFEQTVQTLPGQAGVKFIVELSKGINKLETWFFDDNNKEMCSAYYTKVELIN